MKKSIAVVLSAFICATIFLNAFATDQTYRVYADAVTVECGETVTIPVKIANNGGFMGFAMFVTYDEEVFEPVSATKGSLISGLFNDSISTSDINAFKVVCSETSNVTADGVLFNLIFNIADGVSGKHEIELSYSRQDTFDENWDDVEFACENVEIVITENGTTAATTQPVTQPATQLTTVTATESTTQKQETTLPTTATEPSTAKPVTTQPSVEEATTQPVTEPSEEPENEKMPLSVRMREWVNGLPFPLNIILSIIVIPVSYIVAIFE